MRIALEPDRQGVVIGEYRITGDALIVVKLTPLRVKVEERCKLIVQDDRRGSRVKQAAHLNRLAGCGVGEDHINKRVVFDPPRTVLGRVRRFQPYTRAGANDEAEEGTR
jgi:hypothetical protein